MYKVSRVELDHLDAVKAAALKYERDNGTKEGVGQIVTLGDDEFESLITGKPTASGVSVQPIIRCWEKNAPSQREANMAFNLLLHKLDVSPEKRVDFVSVMVAQPIPVVRWAFESNIGDCFMTRDKDGMYLELIEEPALEEALLLEIKVDDINRRIAMLTYRQENNHAIA